MRVITVKAPQGKGKDVVELAFTSGAKQVSVHQASKCYPDGKQTVLDVVEIETATPNAKMFVEELMAAPFYDPASFAFSVRHPVSIFAHEPPKKATVPVILPTTDVYEELWQFTSVTVSLVTRVFLSAVLLAYGMVENILPLIIAGLLFLPYHHHMLATALGAVIREWRFLFQGMLALFLSTILIVMAGACVALFTNPPVGYDKYSTPLEGFVLSLIIGIAAGMAATDDAGRRELIGLAATAHISVHPAWVGLQLVFEADNTTRLLDHLLIFGINITTLTLAAAITFAIMRMRGDGIRRFVADETGIK
ncbi:DUF389 domain-containing protein [Pontibacter cellulosilyticus]|uniref:DUF389 domain-containing protein n=1 Tax=Pontibacter cellulosilyticus TaxID=1720253 RepID=A0A923SHR5_9BACT|nr:hypothetical protein [Pontibacter cellulosilyticus]MBC5991973.1 hypothetical protein [Pontibacter cellulosilyticus]